MDTRILQEIGLTPGEIKTYLALLKIGSASTGPLAKESQVSRSKLYSILDKLEKKGLTSHIEKRGVTYFQAVEPQKIKAYLQQKEADLLELQEQFNHYLPQLELYQKESGKVEKVTVYSGFKGIRTAHEHVYLGLKKGEEYYYLGVPAFQPEEQHLYWQRDHLRRIKAGLTCKLLFNADVDTKILQNRNSYRGADARYMPTPIKTPACFMMYKNTTLIIIQSPSALAIEIISPEVAASFKEYFMEFWRRSKVFR